MLKETSYFAYYTKKSINFTYLNIIRSKLGLNRVKEPKKNICKPFHIEVENYLSKKYKDVRRIKDFYKMNFRNDDWIGFCQYRRLWLNDLFQSKQKTRIGMKIS